MERLTVLQREAIRKLAELDDRVGGTTLQALERRGLVHPPNDEWPRWRLTEAGRRAYEMIMSTGDGPEALKELLRF